MIFSIVFSMKNIVEKPNYNRKIKDYFGLLWKNGKLFLVKQHNTWIFQIWLHKDTEQVWYCIDFQLFEELGPDRP